MTIHDPNPGKKRRQEEKETLEKQPVPPCRGRAASMLVPRPELSDNPLNQVTLRMPGGGVGGICMRGGRNR